MINWIFRAQQMFHSIWQENWYWAVPKSSGWRLYIPRRQKSLEDVYYNVHVILAIIPVDIGKIVLTKLIAGIWENANNSNEGQEKLEVRQGFHT